MTDDFPTPSDAPLVEGETKKDGVKGFEDLLPLSRAAQAFIELLEERYGVQALSSDQAPATGG